MIERWANVVAHRARRVLIIGILVTIGAATYGFGVFGSLSQGGFDDPDTESARELRLEQETFGNQSVDVAAIFAAPDGSKLRASDPAFEGAVRDVVSQLPVDAVTSVVVPFDLPPEAASPLISRDGTAVQVLVSLAGDSQDDFLVNYDEISPVLESVGGGLSVELAGSYAVYNDVNDITSKDLKRAELISLPIVLLLALLIFGSLVAASMPAVVGVLALIGSLAVLRLLTVFVEVSVFSVNVVSLIGIGLAIDYALFIISRFREELALLPDTADAPQVAIRRTLSTAGRTVLFSGLTVAAAMSSLLIFPQNFLRSMGYGGMAAVLIAMLAALTMLPAALVLLGRRVDAGRLPWRRGKEVRSDAGEARWGRLAHAVMRRPLLVMVATIVVLVAVASPFLGAKWGSVDYRVLPSEAPAHQAFETLNSDFGDEQSTASLLLSGTASGDVERYRADVLALDGVVDVADIAARGTTEGPVTLLRATWVGNSQSEFSQDLVESIRDVTPASGEVLVGGISADTVDLIDSVASHLPWMALIVVVIMMVLLFMAFGSVILPIKAIVMNLFSIGAAFGVITWIFSDGHLSGLLGFESQGFLDATNPILMLAVLFGLSMDYEVFLLSRVREQWDRTGDNTIAVATGVQKTGRIITSAALLLGVVIGAFGTSGIIFMKMLGIGMLVALLIDATIVRALLVPATMKLLGRWNWWAPAPMARWWDQHGFREGPEAGHVEDSAATPEGALAGSR
ncbi:MMPL family transporter [Nocardioides salsibiostraticola]